MAKAKNTCLDLVKKNTNIHIEVEEWIFKDESDAKRIDDALTAPLEDKRSERFAAIPAHILPCARAHVLCTHCE